MQKIVLISIFLIFNLKIALCQDYSHLKGYEYKEIICGNSDGDKSLPVLFALHYSGAKPEDLVNYFANFDFPIKVVFIVGKNTFDDGYTYYPIGYYDESFKPRERTKAQKRTTRKLREFILAYLKENNVQSKKAIIGVSQGGDLSILLSANYPNLFDLAVPIAATIEPNAIFKDPKNKKDVAIKLIHGVDDPIVSIESIREIHSLLQKKNYSVELNEYKGKGHEISDEMINDYTIWFKSLN